MRKRIRTPVAREWLGLREASEHLGISASTLRRWADGGTIRTFVTPGGHRRFSRSAIESILPGMPAARPSMDELGETPSRMARVYRRWVATDAAPGAPIPDLEESERARFREHGHEIVREVLAALDTSDDAVRRERLAGAAAIAADYGAAAASKSVPPAATVETFLRFRRPFLDELSALARRRDFDASTCSNLLGEASAAFDGLLLASLRAYDETAAAALRGATKRVAGAATRSRRAPR